MDTKVKHDGYVVVVAATGALWSTRVYDTTNSAKNSWDDATGARFFMQTEYVVLPVRLVNAETGDYFT